MPRTVGDSETTATTEPETPLAATCPTTAQWQTALHGIVTDLTNQNETDGTILVLINSDGTQPIVKAAP